MITQPITILAFGKKIFSAQNASLLVMAAPGSISLNALLEALVANTPIKALVLPLLVAAISLSLYVVVFLQEFISGVKASRHEADGSNKRRGLKIGKSHNRMPRCAAACIPGTETNEKSADYNHDNSAHSRQLLPAEYLFGYKRAAGRYTVNA